MSHDAPRCSTTDSTGRRCDLFFNHGSYHAALVGDRWSEWFDRGDTARPGPKATSPSK